MPSIPKIADDAMAPEPQEITERQEQAKQHRQIPSLECRNFWRAGSSIAPASASTASHGSLRTSDFDYARVHPKFLHTNATSHKWAFGAIAELLDNAVDEICNGATFVKVDKINNLKDNSPVLLFQDDGGGMDPEGVRRCMSLGFSSKKSKTTIGQYGNGFKTSTMRLGADAIVFSRAIRGSRVTQSIGLLSYTYLRRTMKDDIVVPMIDFQIFEDEAVPFLYSSQDDWDADLKIILEWSPFSSKEELLQQFKDVGLHGTKVLIYNLWMNDDGLLELDFDDEAEDILLRDYANNEGVTRPHKDIVQLHISYTLKHSLRAYASILYLRKFTNFQIILRGVPVQQINMVDEIKFKKVITYKPQVGVDAEVVTVRTTLGFAKEAPVLGIFGFNVYHKNRLIMPFWKVLQEGSSRGRSVVGVLEANFIEPAHDKQDFERTPLFIRLESKLRQMVLDYWKDHCHLIGYQSHVTRAMQKGSGKHSGVVPKMPREVLSAGVHQESQIEEPVIEHNADIEDATYVVPIIRLSAANGSTVLPFEQMQVPDCVMTPSELAEDCVEMDMDVLDSTFIEKIIEENLQLYERRHELQKRQTELKQTVDELERDLERMKRKTLQLASEVELRKRKQHLAGP